MRCPLAPLAFVAAAALATNAQAAQCPSPSAGPDIVAGEIHDVANYGTLDGFAVYSFLTTSCNVGDAELQWASSSPSHPVMAPGIYRLEDGRFEQIGMGWVRHAVAALQSNACCNCLPSGSSQLLGAGCSTSSSAVINGNQPLLGPRSEVNASTGAFNYPYGQQGQSGNLHYKRLRVRGDDISQAEHPGATYFGEVHYVAPDDAAAGNGSNNASWVQLSRSGPANQLTVSGGTNRGEAAIRAYAQAEPGVVLEEINVPGEGQFLVASHAIDLGGGVWRYEYAVHNHNSDFSGQSFAVNLGSGTTANGIGHSFPSYHSGEPYADAAWSEVAGANSVTWSTETHATNPDANALRWGTTYSFWFLANAAPTTSSATLGLFKPGHPGNQLVTVQSPGMAGGDAVIAHNYCPSFPNATGLMGGLSMTGFDLGARTIDIEASPLPMNVFGYFIVSMTQGHVPHAGGSAGVLCLGGNIGRGVAGGVFNTGVTGAWTGTVNLNAVPTPTGSTAVMAGQTWNFQAWHRDIATGPISNFTEGLSVLFF